MKNKIKNLKLFGTVKTEANIIITTHELGKYILENKIIPIPIYTKNREYKRGKVKVKF